MIESLIILFHFFNITLGLVGIIIISRRVTLASADIQKSFILQALFYNFTIIGTAVINFEDMYFWNVVKDNIVALCFVYLLSIINLALAILWIFFFAQMVYKLLNNSISLFSNPWVKKAAIAVGSYLIILLFVRIFKFYKPLFPISAYVISLLGCITILCYSLFLVIKSKNAENQEHKNALRILGILFTSFSSIYLVLILGSYPFRLLPPLVDAFAPNLVDMLFNIIVIFWGIKYLDSLSTKEEPIPISNVSIDLLATKYQISKRELDVINLVCAGKSNQEIADTLFISLGTVKNHLYNIYTKIGIKNRTQLAKLF